MPLKSIRDHDGWVGGWVGELLMIIIINLTYGCDHSSKQLDVSGTSSDIFILTKFSHPLPPVTTNVLPSRCIEAKKCTGSTWPHTKGAGTGSRSNEWGAWSRGGTGRVRMAPEEVPATRW